MPALRAFPHRLPPRYDVAAAVYGAALATPGAAADAFEALPGRVDALLRAGRAADALDAVAAFAASHASAASLADSGLDATDVALLRVKALAASPAGGNEGAAGADALLEELIAASPDDFRPLLAKGLRLRDAGRQLAADKALVRARFLAPKEARKVVDAVIGDR